jgi:hypothetical protein
MNAQALLRTTLVGLVLLLAAGCTQVEDKRPALTFSTATLADARVGQPYDQRIEIAGNVTPVFLYAVQNGLLPTGLKIERVAGSDNAGHIFGTPLTAGTSNFEVYVACFGTNVSGQSGVRAYSITVR